MDNNGRPNHIEDYLVSLHTGQWFGFKNLNGNDANKTYANLVIHDSSKTKPTEKECTMMQHKQKKKMIKHLHKTN